MIDRFPGFLGYGGIIAIHADWPTYPPGLGWKIALQTFGNFPNDTFFYEVDDIDRCKLLINQNPEKLKDPYDYSHFHLAIWHEDLITLKSKGLIDGVLEKTEYEFDLYRFENFKKALGPNLKEDNEGNIILSLRDKDNQFKEAIYYKPKLDEEEDEDEYEYKDCVIINGSLKLTSKGIEELIKLSREVKIVEELSNVTNTLSKISKYDTAIREASILIETKIKLYHNRPDLYGQKLIDYHIQEVIKHNKGFNSAAIKYYRYELRTLTKFIRNDFAHNFKVISQEQFNLVLARISNILTEFYEVTNVYFNKNNN